MQLSKARYLDKYWLAADCRIDRLEEPSQEHNALVSGPNRRFYVGAAVATILESLKDGATIPELARKLDELNNTSLEMREKWVHGLIHSKMVPLGLVTTKPQSADDASKRVTECVQPNAGRSGYISISVTLLRGRPLQMISRMLGGIFNRVAVIFVLPASVWMHSVWLARDGWHSLTPTHYVQFLPSLPIDWLLMFGGVLSLFLIHELGHAAAAARHGINVGRIGFGIYSIFPTFFCDVTEAWRLPMVKRIIISLGGVYFQTILGIIFIIIANVFNLAYFNVVAYLNLLIIVISINPFLRFDGYWIYSDFFKIPNLNSQSIEWLGMVWMSLRGRRRRGPDLTSRPALTVYATLLFVFMLMFSIAITIFYLQLVSNFPDIVGDIARDFVWGRTWNDYLRGILKSVRIAFYVLTGVIIIKGITKSIESKPAILDRS